MRNERQSPKDRGDGGGASSMGLEDEEGVDARMVRERGPLDDDDDRPRVPPKYQKAYEQSQAKLFAELHHVREIAEKLNLAVGTVSHYVHGRGNRAPQKHEMTENAHFCSDAFGSGDVQPEHKSDFLHEKEVLDD